MEVLFVVTSIALMEYTCFLTCIGICLNGSFVMGCTGLFVWSVCSKLALLSCHKYEIKISLLLCT